MPIKTQNDLPVKEILERENIFVMDENRASHQNIRQLEIAIVNLMPLKEDTELQILRSLSNTPIQVNVTFVATSTHEATHTSLSHLNKFYETFDDIKDRYFDGLIITGAPVELMEYEEVDYWDEICKIMEWSKTHAFSTLHLCWGAQAGLYYHYGIPKYPLKKMLAFAIDGITSFSIKPLRMITSIGFIILILSFVVLIYSIIMKLIGNTVSGWTFIVCSIWLIGGIQTLCLGVIGEYIGKIYKETKARPRYIIECVLD